MCNAFFLISAYYGLLLRALSSSGLLSSLQLFWGWHFVKWLPSISLLQCLHRVHRWHASDEACSSLKYAGSSQRSSLLASQHLVFRFLLINSIAITIMSTFQKIYTKFCMCSLAVNVRSRKKKPKFSSRIHLPLYPITLQIHPYSAASIVSFFSLGQTSRLS